MKIKSQNNDSFIFAEGKQTKFVVQNSAVVMSILRDKIYKDKIDSMCREILSNCYDAHIESKTNKNVEIHIVDVYNDIEGKFIVFKDYGIGLSEDRVENVFCSYAVSTKTDNNKQIGGFGLGAKTPFAYTDTFYIKTRNNGVEYFYISSLDRDNVGTLTLLYKKHSEELSGTEIIVPIENGDLHRIESSCLKNTFLWKKVNVDFYGFFKEFKTKTIIDEKDYKVLKIEDGCPFYKNEGFVINLGGIPYFSWRPKHNDYLGLTDYLLIFNFEVGELTPTVSRENIEETKENNKNLEDKYLRVKKDLMNRFVQLNKEFDNFSEAVSYYNKTNSIKNELTYFLIKNSLIYGLSFEPTFKGFSIFKYPSFFTDFCCKIMTKNGFFNSEISLSRLDLLTSNDYLCVVDKSVVFKNKAEQVFFVLNNDNEKKDNNVVFLYGKKDKKDFEKLYTYIKELGIQTLDYYEKIKLNKTTSGKQLDGNKVYKLRIGLSSTTTAVFDDTGLSTFNDGFFEYEKIYYLEHDLKKGILNKHGDMIKTFNLFTDKHVVLGSKTFCKKLRDRGVVPLEEAFSVFKRNTPLNLLAVSDMINSRIVSPLIPFYKILIDSVPKEDQAFFKKIFEFGIKIKRNYLYLSEKNWKDESYFSDKEKGMGIVKSLYKKLPMLNLLREEDDKAIEGIIKDYVKLLNKNN